MQLENAVGDRPQAVDARQDRLPDEIAQVLRILMGRLEGAEIDWVLTGSAAFALRGLALAPQDLDLQSDAAGIYRIERLLLDDQLRPVEFVVSEQVRSHWGQLEVEGVRVDLIGDIEKRLPDGQWTAPPDLAAEREWLDFEGQPVPVLNLAYESQAYEQLGRSNRANMLRSWLAEPPVGHLRRRAEGT